MQEAILIGMLDVLLLAVLVNSSASLAPMQGAAGPYFPKTP